METGNEIREFPICSVCEGKYGAWAKIKDKLLSMNIPDALRAELNEEKRESHVEEKKPLECTLNYSGGDKSDVIYLICGLMDQEDITLEEVEEMMW